MQTDDVSAIFQALEAQRPHPRGELNHDNPFQLLVAVVLSAQATDVGVNKATPALFAAAPNPRALADLGVEGIKHFIRTIGLYNSKAQHLHALALALLERHGGEVPGQRAALEALPGVGRKSANVVLNIAFGQPVIAVDTHVFRVANRTGLAPGRTPEAVERALMATVPTVYLGHAHHWLVLHGRHVCRARQPLCADCVISTWCREYPGP
ncbi:MAG: endonuclease III [Magnetococcus sp. WYHC-3]